MEGVHFFYLAIGLVTGWLLIGLSLGFWGRRLMAFKERERALAHQEMETRLQLDYERKLGQLERAVAEREGAARAREEEAMASLLNAEKEKDLLEKRRSELDGRLQALDVQMDRVQSQQGEYRRRLQDLGHIDAERARALLVEETRREVEDELRALKYELLQSGTDEIQAEARRVLVDAMQRIASQPQQDVSATIVSIPGEDMKGRIIGREGRNIKSFESLTGTTLLIDETPDSVLISSFDPVRRETARLALEALIRDGRIHPASIEESVRSAEIEVRNSVAGAAEDAIRRLKLTRIHPEVVQLIGKLRFRLSNNQNSLDHSIEVANLCALMAAELGLDPMLAKRSGLLHDIGKALDQDQAGSHALAGGYFLKRYGEEDPRVINAVAGHHGEVPAESPYVALVMIADAISAQRPGARSDSVSGFIQRVKNLEAIARAQPGVVECYAIQAGREIRVVVQPEAVSETDCAQLARTIRRRIEDELQYPGTIRITLIREQRFTETAK
jgi:ribonucrease Y